MPKNSSVDRNPDLDRWSNGTFAASLDTLNSYQIFTELGLLAGVARSHLIDMSSSQGLLYIPHRVHLRNITSMPHSDDAVVEAAFSISFTMSAVDQSSSMNQTTATEGRTVNTTSPGFLILPDSAVDMKNQQLFGASGLLATTNTTLRKGLVATGGGDVYVEVRKLGDGHLVVLNVTIIEPAAARYTVWIDYSPSGHLLSVYVNAGEGNPRPEHAITVVEQVSFSHEDYSEAYFAFFGSVGQLLRLRTFNSTVHWQCPDTPSWHDILSILIHRQSFIVISMILIAELVMCIVILYSALKLERWEDMYSNVARGIRCLEGTPAEISFAYIRRATDNFNERNRLGAGGYGAVYRCTLPAAVGQVSSVEGAVKKFTQTDANRPRSREAEDRRLQNFVDEVRIINLLRHRNIVPLVGWSFYRGTPLLIYQYMMNGSLDQHLFQRGGSGQEESTTTLQWDTRYGIVRDIATGLRYIHHEHTPTVLHRDIKASNILLDSNFCARLGDFGISCTVSADKSSVSGVGGTRGYIAPECHYSGKNTRQTDIYAFGVLVLEIVTGKKWDFQIRMQPESCDHITVWLWRLHKEGKLLEAVDVVLTTGGHQVLEAMNEAKRLLLLGLACTAPNPLNRPSMVEVVHIINKLAPPPEVPLEMPRFVWPPEGWRSHNSIYSTAGSEIAVSLGSMVELMPFSEEPLGFSGGEASVSAYHTPTTGSPEHHVAAVRGHDE